jgi:predicted CopG family antitoxin
MKEFIELKRRTINIALKADTKKELDKLSSSRRDSYDDIIRRLIRKHNQHANIEMNTNQNKIILLNKLKRREGTIKIDEIKIKYSFNIPQKEGLSNYTFDIHYIEVLKNNKLVSKEYTQSSLKRVQDYAKIIEKTIQTYIDPIFKLEKINFEKYDEETYRNIFNLDWWERKFKNAGLNYECFKQDIKEKFIKLGAV